MKLVCLDLEGVLVPEIWQAVAADTGVEALKRTTRDEPDYDVLMRQRLEHLDRHGIDLPHIQRVISGLRPLTGAVAFMQWLTTRVPTVILSDTFVQFAEPLMAQLAHPTLFCHELVVENNGRISGYQLRQPDQKRKAVMAFRSLNFEIIAGGDSYNDLSMLLAADHGILFRPSDAFAAENPALPVTRSHDELRAALEKLGV